MQRTTKEFLSPGLLLGLLAVIFGAAFALNFITLSLYAADVVGEDLFGKWFIDFMESILPYAFPLLIDFFLVMATAIVLRNTSVGESAKLAWLVVAFTTLAAITLNSIHYDVLGAYQKGEYMQMAKAAIFSVIVPATILMSSELARGLLQSVQRRSMFTQTTAQLKEEATQAQTQHDELIAQLKAQSDKAQAQLKAQKEKLNAQREAQERERSAHQQQLNDLLNQMDAAKAQLGELQHEQSLPSQEWVQALQINALKAAGATHKAACARVGVSENTGRTREGMLNGFGLA